MIAFAFTVPKLAFLVFVAACFIFLVFAVRPKWSWLTFAQALVVLGLILTFRQWVGFMDNG